MNNLSKTIIACVIFLVVGLVIGNVLGGAGKVPTDFGATVYNRMISFDEGIAVDGTERISGTGGASFTTGSFSSTLGVTGNTTLAGTLAVQQTSSSTVYIGATLKAGCIVLGDSANGANVVYITASGVTITAATTTKPAACR
jgi:hypothetical protein